MEKRFEKNYSVAIDTVPLPESGLDDFIASPIATATEAVAVSPVCMVRVAVQIVGPPPTESAALPSMVTVGVWIDSLDVNERVTTLPTWA